MIIIDFENVLISSNNVQCSDFTEDITSLNAKFIICSFDANLNGVKLNRATIDNWLYTLVSQPVVGKISIQDSGDADFTSHNMNEVIRIDQYGNPYTSLEFDSSACGVFTSVQIERINNKEYITACAKLWKRFPEFCAVIKKRLLNGTLNTSWEIATVKSHIELISGKQVKVIDEGRFLGHSLLAKYIPSAYPESRLLEVAQKQDGNDDLINALNKDLSSEITKSNIVIETEDQILVNNNKTKDVVSVAPVVDVAEVKDTSALTEYDLRQSLRQAIAKRLGSNVDVWDFYVVYNFPANMEIWIHMYESGSELDIIKFTYSVDENDVVTVSDPLNTQLTVSVSQINDIIASYIAKEQELSESLVKANSLIQTLTTEVSTLQPYKEAMEKAEQEKVELEQSSKREALKAYALSSKLISEIEVADDADIKVPEIADIKSAIEQLDKAKINSIIAERFMQKQVEDVKEVSNIDVSTVAVGDSNVVSGKKQDVIKASLEDDVDIIPAHRKFMSSYINN